ncbi:bifunctional molybdenum cofactor biosynthesis protein MoaC/MoaB [Salibacteraceae bacterium]|nr:bifunctional molybdenum cofactor biosynthesis protein MoaC/MoaB [Crocinitomicaceae bacterium]MCH9822736.1 bifunctional molybdenum cofactor biosynthesis protein MoaC/MoaB [Bacteroidota bacterium]MDB9725926.1 bifunctional molybdenum cofactor biosynthesis protein MoaC/MoaB [Salibacteraceae bacterium]|tara:strand:+ start:23063 stop:23971 length:909 start_codon:yes stop_codon:yes gene_type:complete
MLDITHKSNTLRIAVAQAIVQVSKQETIQAIEEGTVPKGDVFSMAKAAGLLGVKKTWEMMPDCHPLPIEFTGIEYAIEGLNVIISVTVKTIYKTGVEVEAMHGASIVALTLYDMLKPIDKGVEINNIKLLSKKGGKSDWKDKFRKDLTASVIVCSDTISAGQKEDRAGLAICEKLKTFDVTIENYSIIPDELNLIQAEVSKSKNKHDLLIFTGGTGMSVRDVTPDAVRPLLDREMAGVMEAARSYGQERTPFSMLSRGVAGTAGRTVVLTLPGSTKGASETMDALFPALLHIFKIIGGGRHD